MLNIAVRAARSAGNVIARGFENFDDLQIEQKGENDFVTKIDREAEQTIIYKIQQSYPDHTFVGEEGGIVAGNVKDEGVKAIKQNGPYILSGEPALMENMDTLLQAFVDQGRMKLPGSKYVPCYKIKA